MPEIRGYLSREGISQGLCVWCGRSSTSRMIAPGRGGIEVPLHALCAASIIVAYRRASTLRIPPPRLREYAERVQRIGAGPRVIEAGEDEGQD